MKTNVWRREAGIGEVRKRLIKTRKRAREVKREVEKRRREVRSEWSLFVTHCEIGPRLASFAQVIRKREKRGVRSGQCNVGPFSRL